MTDEWVPEPMKRLQREREGLVKKRDELQADVTNYNGAIFRLDARIKEWSDKMNGEATNDG
jgi:uncharacterized coiled-coil DUF342 family protein